MEPTPQPNPEQLATDYLATELEATRRSAKRTRWVCGGSILFVTAYMTFLVVTLHTRLFAPQPAAELIGTYAMNTADANLESFANYVKESGPEAIGALPDVVIDRLPIIRASIEEQLEGALRQYTTELASGLDEHLQTFLAEHEDDLHAFFALSQDPTFVTQFGDGLERELVRLLDREIAEGRSARDTIHDGLIALRELELRLDRLAFANDLTPQEQRLRQIIAITLKLSGERA